MTPSQRKLELKQRILAEGKEQSSNLIDQYKTGKIRLKPGWDALQFLVLMNNNWTLIDESPERKVGVLCMYVCMYVCLVILVYLL